MILSGFCRVTKDAVVRHTASGEPVCNLSLAFNWGKKGEDGKRPTTFVDGALWGKRAEAMAQYLTKGQPVDVVLTDVHIETYPKNDGGTGFSLRGNVQVIDFAGKGPEREGASQEPARRPDQQSESSEPPKSKPVISKGDPFGGFEDDIPF